MAYQIDFTASIWTWRRRRKALLRLLLLAAVAGVVCGIHYIYTTYNQPTLNMKLAEYEAVARPIEEINAVWDDAAKEYNALLRYYRLVWAANPTNFLCAMASKGCPRLGRGFRPASWTLHTGGGCRLEYVYVFEPGDKAKQAKIIETNIVHSITSVVDVVDGKVDVQGVQHENLLNVDKLNITVKFSLPDVRSFPVKERILADCASEIVAMRKKVKDTKIVDSGDVKGAPNTIGGIMIAYLPAHYGEDKDTKKVRSDFPDVANVIDVSSWFERADKFIKANRIPGNDAKRLMLKEIWKKTGDARFPWDRLRVLDNNELVVRTKALSEVADGVKPFKDFLEQRRADCRKKAEPFVVAYDRNDVFNKPLIETDLNDRVAKVADITGANVDFKDEAGATPAVLVKEDETFAFTWVRWTLNREASIRNREEGMDSVNAVPESLLTLEKVADCTRRVLELGPGYVLDKVKVDFGKGGNVSGATLEGLLPVKKVESKKEKTGNVN